MYIVHINFKLFLHNNDGEMILSPNHTTATEYNNIGDAMRSAAKINKDAGLTARILRK